MINSINVVLIFILSIASAFHVHKNDYTRANFCLLLALFNLATMIYFK